MKRLILLRHAKSDWDAGSGTDHERPLNARGRRDAPRIGEALAALGWSPETVLSSDARRTRETWELMRPSIPGAPAARLSNTLYLGDLDAIRVELETLPASVETALVIGHNPGWEEAASTLAGRDVAMTTCNAALLSVESDTWPEAAALEACWHLHRLLRPKEL